MRNSIKLVVMVGVFAGVMVLLISACAQAGGG